MDLLLADGAELWNSSSSSSMPRKVASHAIVLGYRKSSSSSSYHRMPICSRSQLLRLNDDDDNKDRSKITHLQQILLLSVKHLHAYCCCYPYHSTGLPSPLLLSSSLLFSRGQSTYRRKGSGYLSGSIILFVFALMHSKIIIQ